MQLSDPYYRTTRGPNVLLDGPVGYLLDDVVCGETFSPLIFSTRAGSSERWLILEMPSGIFLPRFV